MFLDQGVQLTQLLLEVRLWGCLGLEPEAFVFGLLIDPRADLAQGFLCLV